MPNGNGLFLSTFSEKILRWEKEKGLHRADPWGSFDDLGGLRNFALHHLLHVSYLLGRRQRLEHIRVCSLGMLH